MRTALALLAGIALGFGAGWLAFEQPWDSGTGSVTLAQAGLAFEQELDTNSSEEQRARRNRRRQVLYCSGLVAADTIVCSDTLCARATIRTEGDRIVSVKVVRFGPEGFCGK